MAPKAKRSVADLLEEKRVVKGRLAANREALRSLERAEREAIQQADDSIPRVTPGNKAIALVLYSFAGCRVGPAVDYLLRPVCVARGSEDAARRTYQTLVEDWVLSMDPSDLADLSFEDTTPSKHAFRMACSYYPKWRLGQWVSTRNTEDSVAPTTRQCMQQYDAFLREDLCCREDGDSEVDEGVRALGHGKMQPKDRMFASRWRRRVGVHLGTPKINEPSSREASRQKALPFSINIISGGPIPWTVRWSRFLDFLI